MLPIDEWIANWRDGLIVPPVKAASAHAATATRLVTAVVLFDRVPAPAHERRQ